MLISPLSLTHTQLTLQECVNVMYLSLTGTGTTTVFSDVVWAHTARSQAKVKQPDQITE